MHPLLTPAPRVVRPRTRKPRKLPVVVITQTNAINEHGQLLSIHELLNRLPTMTPRLFACRNAADFIAMLDERYSVSHPNTWQWRAATHERDIVRPGGVRVASRVSTIIHYFGWKNGNFHKIIDPVSMYGHSLDRIYPGDEHVDLRLMKWAVALRDFCHENGIEVRPTTGSLSAQFLTDPRFYPKARRKVPAATNANVREQLPGNHYHLATEPTPKHEFTAYYIDQTRSHHYHAKNIAFPNADTLYAYGAFRNLDVCVFDKPVDNFYGLYCLDLEVTGTPPFTWLKPPIDGYTHDLRYRLEKQFVYSNELQHLLDMGYSVTGIRAAWGSRHRDSGLSAYARWCEAYLDEHGNPRWLKQLLLSAYGTLATRPLAHQAVFKMARAGEPVTLHTGARQLSGLLTEGARKLEPRIANVLHRGMIEAGTRSDSVGLAQYLDALGHNVLSIYADAVIVEADDDNPLPPIPDPWRIQETLNHLQFINQQAFTSGEMTKLPGVGRELRKYRQEKPGVAPTKRIYNLAGEAVATGRKI